MIGFDQQAPFTWKTGTGKGVVHGSTTMVEIDWASRACREIRHTRELLQFMRIPNPEPCKLYIDNAAAVITATAGVRHFSPRLKHLDIKQKFVREAHRMKIVDVLDVDTLENPAEVLTKPASLEMLCRHFLALHGYKLTTTAGVSRDQQG